MSGKANKQIVRGFGSAWLVSTACFVGCIDEPLTSGSTQEIVGGQVPGAGALEGVAFVTSAVGSCSGAIITNDFVLTAAHCVCDGGTCVDRARAQFRDPTTGNRTGPQLEGTVTHAGTTFGQPDDMALIRLDTPAPWFAQPFSTARTDLPAGSPMIIAGYAATNCSHPTDFGVLKSVGGKHLDRYFNHMIEYEQQLVCPGDAGGPHLLDTGGILASFEIAGVSSEIFNGPFGDKTFAATTAWNDVWLKQQICSSPANSCTAGPADACACSATTSLVWRNTGGVVALWQLDGNIFHDVYPGATTGSFQIAGAGDFDGDGHQDLLLRDSTGQTQIWFLDGNGGRRLVANVGGTDPTHQWAIQTVADFDGDGRSDILWRATNGQLAIWPGANNLAASYPTYQDSGNPSDPAWKVVAAGDFDGDGRADILWLNGTTLAIWLMNGGHFIADLYPGNIDTGGGSGGFAFGADVFQGLGDFNGDGKADALWRAPNGTLKVWFAGQHRALGPAWQNTGSGTVPAAANPAYEIIGIGDVDRDGRDDLIWRDVGHNGYISIWLLDGVRFIGDYQARAPTDTGPRFVDSSWVSYRTQRERGF